MAGLLFVAAQSLIKYNNPAKITTDYMHISKIDAYDYFLIFKSSSRGLLFVAAQSLADEQQKNGSSAIHIPLSIITYHLSLITYHFQECWCPGVRRPINKYLAVRPNVACANRYVGYLASGEKASVIQFTFL